jgi:hypothetical protein
MSTDYPRETIEFQPVTVTVDGVAVTTGVQLCTVPNGSRPTGWAAPTALSGKIGVMVTGLAPGLYGIWAQITSSPEIPVINCGTISVT